MFTIRRNEKIRYTFSRVKIDYGISIFFYNPNTGTDYVTNQLGAVIWLLMEHPIGYDKILEEVYKMGLAVERNKLEEDIRKVCDIMVKQQIAEYLECEGYYDN